MMTPQIYTSMVVSAVGMVATWCIWVSVSLFKHTQEIALLRQEITILKEVTDILHSIKEELKYGRLNQSPRRG